jgi:uncharacterized membrane protein YphA (DoxX/SURF4 family)
MHIVPKQWSAHSTRALQKNSCNLFSFARSILLRGANMTFDSRLDHAWWVLRIGLGLGPLIAGADKFTDLLTNWEMYLNPLVPRILHVAPATFMHVVGVIEMIVGVLVLTRFTRYAAYIVMIWLIAIALNLVTQGSFLDLAVRDLEIALGAFALAKLTEVREAAIRLCDSSSGDSRVQSQAIA